MASRREAAENLIKASDSHRELSRVGRDTAADAERVRDARSSYDAATKAEKSK